MRTPALKLVWEADGLEIDLLPLQGLWTEEQYLRLTDQTNRFIEFTEGSVEVLPMPTRKHQAISRFLFLAFLASVQRLGGTVFYAPLRVRVAPGRFREPDLVLLLTVLTLEDGAYIAHGVFRRGETATSALLTGFTVRVDAVCDAV
jgi:hypothetical protein